MVYTKTLGSISIAMVFLAVALGLYTRKTPVVTFADLNARTEPALLLMDETVVPSRSYSYPSNLVRGDTEVNEIGQRPIDNSVRVVFTIHPNGDGTGEGTKIQSWDYKHIDEVIEEFCCDLMNTPEERCAPRSGARLVTETGVRMLSFNDVEEGQRVYCVPQGLHFVWPLKKTGYTFYPKNVIGPIPGKPIRMRQLTEKPRVFSVENFVSPEEVEEILRANRNRLQRSEVGFGGWQDDTRTSSTSWDFTSKASIAIQKRTFEILGMDYEPEHADAMQVLRYTPPDEKYPRGQWYKPHVDWFNAESFEGHDPTVDNGTNRFATMFLYLSDVAHGGATVFPYSTTHEGYNGEELVHPGSENTPGYINTEQARYCCNESSTALRSQPKQGNAVLFYSQGPDGALDAFSLHGGCPPLTDEKWSANVWIWNRKRADKSKAKDLPTSKGPQRYSSDPDAIDLDFQNGRSRGPINIYWDSTNPTENLEDAAYFQEEFDKDILRPENERRFVLSATIEPKEDATINTFHGHVFLIVDPANNAVLGMQQANKEQEDDVVNKEVY